MTKHQPEIAPQEQTQPLAATYAVEVGPYKANPKVFNKRDGLKKAQLEAEILMRFDPKDTNSSLEMIHLNNFYPLIRFGVAEAEGFAVPLTEEAFWELPEQFVFDLSEAIQEANPQYAVPFSALQEMMWAGFRKSTDPLPTDT